MKVTAIIVTRGNVDLTECIRPLPDEWELVVWDNGLKEVWIVEAGADKTTDGAWEISAPASDLAVYGRYAAIEHATGDLIYVQDDDCIVSDPEALVRAWEDSREQCNGDFDPRYLWHASPDEIRRTGRGEHVVCNMPQPFRHRFYRDHALVGFGAVFHRDQPSRAFDRFEEGCTDLGRVTFIAEQKPQVVLQEPEPLAPAAPGTVRWTTAKVLSPSTENDIDLPWFWRTCDIVFTALTPRVLVDVPYRGLPWESAPERMWKQPAHQKDRDRMLELCLQVRDRG